MKLLLEKNIVLSGENLDFKLMFDDKFPHGMEKDENEQDYILNISITKGTKLKSVDIVREIQDVLAEYFLNSNEHKKALYVPKTHEVSVYGEGFIDVFYQMRYKHRELDKGYETDDGEIGKNLISVDLGEPTETTNVIRMEFKSLFLVDELYHIQTLWDIDNGKVYDFLLEEILTKMNEF